MREDYAALKIREQEVHDKYDKLKATEKELASREAALFKREERARNLKLKLTEQAMTIKAEKILKRLKNTDPNNLT